MDAVICSCHPATPKDLRLTSPWSYVFARAKEFEVAPELLLGSKRDTYLVRIRAVIAGELRQMGHSFPEIGRALNRHHSTVMHLLALSTKLPDRAI